MSIQLKKSELLYSNDYFQKGVKALLLVLTAVSFIFLIIYFWKSELSGDDLAYFKTVDVTWSWIINTRYLAWSSRVFIDVLIPFFVDHELLLKITCIVFLLISPLILLKLFKGNTLIHLLFCFVIISLFPYYEMKTAGFAATVLNYYFPIVLGLFLCAAIYNNCKFNLLSFFIILIVGIFACNHEQCVVIIFTFSLFAIISSWPHLNVRALETLVISILSLVFIFMSPGNAVRMSQEMQNWMPEFATFSLFAKVYMGITTTFYNLCYHNNLPFVFCFVVLVLCLTKKLRWAIASLIVLSICQELLRKRFKSTELLENATWLTSYPSLTLILFFTYAFVLLLISVKLDMSFQNRVVIIVMILLAFALRGVIGLSPTVFASGVRTSIFSQTLFVICSGYAMMHSKVNTTKISLLLSYFVYVNFHKFIFNYTFF